MKLHSMYRNSQQTWERFESSYCVDIWNR